MTRGMRVWGIGAVALAFAVLASQAAAQTTTTTTSTTTGTGTTIGAEGLNEFFSRPGVVASIQQLGLSKIFVSGASGGTLLSVTIEAFVTIGPATIPIGNNVATCTGAPTSWPPGANCTLDPGATSFTVNAGTVNVNANAHTQTNTVLGADSSLFGLVFGDFHTSFQTALLDQNWSFLDAVFGRLRGFGTVGAGPGAMLPGAQFASATVGDDATRGVALTQRGPDGRMRETPWMIWFRPHGTLGKVDDSNERLGFRYDIAGITAGAEYRWPGPWLAGATLGYAHASVTQRLTGDKGGVDSLQLGLYGGYRGERTHVLAAALFAQNWIGSERLTALAPTTAKAGYTGQAYTLGVEAGRKYPVMRAWVQPFASLIYTHLRQGRFTESGSTLLEISGDSQSANALKLSFGARVWRDFDFGWGRVTPEFRGRWVQDILNERRAITGRFVGDPAQTSFTVNGTKPAPAAAILGAGVTAHFDRDLKVTLGYDAELRANARSHTIQATLKFTW